MKIINQSNNRRDENKFKRLIQHPQNLKTKKSTVNLIYQIDSHVWSKRIENLETILKQSE